MASERTTTDRDDLRRGYEEGMSTVDLATMFDLTPGTVARRLRAAGVRIRTASEASRLAKGVDVDMSDVIARHDNGDSVLAIATAAGVSRGTIVRRLRAAGIPIRTGSEANRIRMSRIDVEGRRRLTAPANAERQIGRAHV